MEEIKGKIENREYEVGGVVTNPHLGTIRTGSVTTVPYGQPATVVNSGTEKNAILDFVIPQGPQGEMGPRGFKGDKGDTGPQGEQGIRGPKGDKGDVPDISNLATKSYVDGLVGDIETILHNINSGG